MIDTTIDDEVDAETVLIKERLGVEALIAVVISLSSDGIDESDEMVSALYVRDSYNNAPNILDLELTNRTIPPA